MNANEAHCTPTDSWRCLKRTRACNSMVGKQSILSVLPGAVGTDFPVVAASQEHVSPRPSLRPPPLPTRWRIYEAWVAKSCRTQAEEDPLHLQQSRYACFFFSCTTRLSFVFPLLMTVVSLSLCLADFPLPLCLRQQHVILLQPLESQMLES